MCRQVDHLADRPQTRGRLAVTHDHCRDDLVDFYADARAYFMDAIKKAFLVAANALNHSK